MDIQKKYMEQIKKIREKKHRLDKKLYTGFVRVIFTLCIENRQQLFIEKNENVINKFLEILKIELDNNQIINYIYVFMPEHLHLIIEGRAEESDLLKALNMFKMKTGYWLSKNNYEEKWQKDYYDHIHRKHEKLKEHIRYIAENPIRRKLVDNYRDYKYLGSLHFELKELIEYLW